MNGDLLIAGNWKANGTAAHLRIWAAGFDSHTLSALLFVPDPYLRMAVALLDGKAKVGAQNISDHGSGSHTGNTIAAQVADTGAPWTLIGHSERRETGETDEQVAAKVKLALESGLQPLVCVGESLIERERGELENVLSTQLNAVADQLCPCDVIHIAYEPVWAIGTGKAATSEDAQAACELVEEILRNTRCRNAKINKLYGGSVKPENSASYTAMPSIDGLLVGGASFEAESFSQICAACARG